MQLAAMTPSRVDISLYSDIPEVHDAVVRRPGAFAKSLKAILLLQESGANVAAILTLLKGFCDNAEAATLGLRKRGVKLVGFNTYRAYNCQGWAERDLAVDDSALEYQLLAIPGRPRPRFVRPDDPLCMGVAIGIYVRPDGTVQPCVSLGVHAGSLLETSLAELWNDSPVLKYYRNLRRKDLSGCAECGDRTWCGYCPARAYNETGDPTKPVPDMCQATRFRKSVLERQGAA